MTVGADDPDGPLRREHKASDVGRLLADARQRRGLSLENLSLRTKIPIATLRAIERDELADLPGGLYTRALLRAFASEVGHDPEAIVGRYRSQSGEQHAADGAAVSPDGRSDADAVHACDIDEVDLRRGRAHLIAWALALVVGIAYVVFDRVIRVPRTTANAVGVIRIAGRSSDTPTPDTATVGTAGPAGTDGSTRGETAALRLDVQPRGLCWLEAAADGQRVIYRLMNAGEHARIDAEQEVALRIGDAAACDFTINDSAARAPGRAGEAVTIHLTRQNYRDFLSR